MPQERWGQRAPLAKAQEQKAPLLGPQWAPNSKTGGTGTEEAWTEDAKVSCRISLQMPLELYAPQLGRPPAAAWASASLF